MTNLAALTVILAAAVLIALWLLEVRTPRRVRWREVVLDSDVSVPARVADGLVLQHHDGDEVWASRGYSIYLSSAGGAFRKVARIVPPLGEAWGGYLRSLRRRFGYQELVEVVPLDEGRLVAIGGGCVHVFARRAGRGRRTHRLRWFGRGRGRGLMAFGVCRATSGDLYFAEYVTESGDRPTGVWHSADGGRRWQLVFEFEAGQTRHIHAVQEDPVDGSIWIGSGDRDEHCFVGRSHDGAHSFEWVGTGAQRYRTCAFACFDDVVMWGMDADFEQNHVIRYHRGSGAVTVDAALPDATYYARRIDDTRAVLGIAQGVAEAWIADTDGAARRWLGWGVPAQPPVRGPSPGVRLARGGVGRDAHVLLNPLRTLEHEAAIYRIDARHVPAAHEGEGA